MYSSWYLFGLLRQYNDAFAGVAVKYILLASQLFVTGSYNLPLTEVKLAYQSALNKSLPKGGVR